MALNPALRRRIAQAQTTIQKDPVIRDGQYIMLIRNMSNIDAATTGVGDMFHGDLRVEKATAVTQGVEPNPVGSICATKCNFSTNRAAMSNVKGMIAGAIGIADPMALSEAEWENILDWVFSDQQPMRGMLIAGSTFRTTIKNGKNAGQPFVGVNWSQVQQTAAEIAQRRAQLDAIDASAPPAPTPPQRSYAPAAGYQPQAPYAPQQAPSQPYAPPQQAPYAPGGYAPQGAYAPPQAPPQFASQPSYPQQQTAPPVQPTTPPYGQQPPQGWPGRY